MGSLQLAVPIGTQHPSHHTLSHPSVLLVGRPGEDSAWAGSDGEAAVGGGGEGQGSASEGDPGEGPAGDPGGHPGRWAPGG